MSKGVILLALERSIYGRMAFNSALCVRALMPNLPIHLFYSGDSLKSLSPVHRSFFSNIEELPKEYFTYDDKFKPFRCKSRIYEISPFDETLYLDADTAIFRNKKFLEFWNQPKREIEIQTFNLINLTNGSKVFESEHHSGLWLKYNLMAAHYGIEKKTLPQMNSSFMYFRKGERAEEFFNLTKTLFDSPDAPAPNFRGEFPDEFFFQTAGAMLEVFPTNIPFVPLFGSHETKYKGNHQLFTEYMGIMTYGLKSLNHVKAAYNDTIYNYQSSNPKLNKIPIFYHEDKIQSYKTSSN